METVYSTNKVPIRLTSERWLHIVENHDDMAGYYDDVLQTIESPDFIIKGYRDALIALRRTGKNKFLSVVYKELSKSDGFVITAYFTKKLNLEREVILWQKQD